MTETPYNRYTYPEEGEENWNRDEGPENIWEQQEIEITGEVEQYIDLPDPDPDAETDDGQRRTYLVSGRKTIYRDTGSEWEAVAGVGDEENPLPGTSHFERAKVYEEPEDATDVVRWTDLDGVGGGDVSNPLEEDLDADGEYTVTNLRGPEQDGDAETREFVLNNAGGNGEGDVSNPMTEDLDAGGHDIEDVGSVNAEEATIGGVDFAEKADSDGDDLTPHSIDSVTIYASQYSTLNEAIDENDDANIIHLILPIGETPFDGTISLSPGQDIYIGGYGPRSVIKGEGPDRLLNQSQDRPSSVVCFKNLTIDMDHIPTRGQILNINGEIHRLHLDGVHIKNLNVDNQGGNNGFIRIQEPTTEFEMANCHVDYTEDSLINRTNNKYKIIHQTTAGLVDRMSIYNNHHEGHLYDRGDHNIDYINGYDANVTQSCQFYSNTFYKWDQYAIHGRCYSETASIQILNNHAALTNSGDQFRAGASGDMGSVQMIGNIHAGTGRTDDTDEKLQGDRSCVIEGGRPHRVIVSNNVVYDSLTPYSSPACRYTEFSNNLAINCGSFGSGSRSMIIHSQGDNDVGYVMIRDNSFINEVNNRHVDNCIRIREVTGDGGGWDAECIVTGNVFKGYSESNAVDNEIGDLMHETRNFDLD